MATAEPMPAEKGWTTLQVKRTFPASRERVFEAWMDPEQLRQWLAPPEGSSPSAEVDARVGGEFRISMKSPGMWLFAHLPGRFTELVHMVGRYQEISPPERLVFTMGWEDFPFVHMDREASTVTVEFHERGDETEVILTHERQPSRRIRAFHRYGWSGSLRKLENLLGGEPAR
jgi:uncharacterized protein YndB with AHSA1/START domain